MNSRNTFESFIALALLGALALSACGIRGELKTPPPLWGDQGDKPIEKQESNT